MNGDLTYVATSHYLDFGIWFWRLSDGPWPWILRRRRCLVDPYDRGDFASSEADLEVDLSCCDEMLYPSSEGLLAGLCVFEFRFDPVLDGRDRNCT